MTTTTIDTAAGPMVIDEDELQIGRFLDADGNIPTHDEALAFMRRHVRQGDSVVDVGANAGFFTLALADMVGERGRVYAYEPNIAVAKHLSASISQRRLRQVYLSYTAIGIRRRWSSLRFDPRGPGGTQVLDDPDPDKNTILVRTLDKEVFRRPVSFIKIDTEGMDVEVLMGAGDILETDRPVVMFEWNPEKIESLGKWMADEHRSLWKVTDQHRYVVFEVGQESRFPWGWVIPPPGDYALIPREQLDDD